jgi:hypothetical protein
VSEQPKQPTGNEIKKRTKSGHLIGCEVVVKLVNGEVIRGTFLDDYRHSIAIRRSEDGRILNIGWDKILYIEGL